MRRRFRRSRGGRRSSRKVRWLNSHVWLSQESFTPDTLATWWLKQPSNSVDIFLATQGSEPADETLIRTLWWPYATKFTDNQNTGFFSFGAICFDSLDPAALEAIIWPGGSAALPDPYFGADDWILKKTYVVTGGSQGAGLASVSYFPTMDFDMQSRAQRKLPPDTGVLGVCSWHQADGDTVTWSVGVESRIAVKSGYKI